MNRRLFLNKCSVAIPGIILANKMKNNFLNTGNFIKSGYSPIPDDDVIKKYADIAISNARSLGSEYADFRLTRFRNQFIGTRENSVQHINDNDSIGFSVRVLKNGTWGFAASSTINEKEVKDITKKAVEIADANSILQQKKIILAPVPAYNDEWKSPIKTDPFSISIDEKLSFLLNLNEKGKSLGADYTESFLNTVNEVKYFASSEGSFIKQDLYRIFPRFEITVIDKESGTFETRNSLAPPISKGYEHISEYDFNSDLEKAVEETKAVLKSKSVEPGKYDIILDPSNMWLTIHESCGHPSELDRALGYEANYAGTSFLTPDKLNKLKYGSDLVNLVADRTQKHGLATRGYDDDGVKTTRWHIIKDGLFVGYQTTREMANIIGDKESNACAYADSWEHFPIQRMPNVSLQPGTKKLSLKELIADTERGIYIVGDGSWSIDMQRYNFQFTGQVFYEITNGQITGLLKDVAYQGNTVDFWNSCDAICDESEYRLYGAMNCGKGEPSQISPVGHGSSPARFRQINILNTSKEAK